MAIHNYLRFGKLVANLYEFVQYLLKVFVQSATSVMVMFSGIFFLKMVSYVFTCIVRIHHTNSEHFPMRSDETHDTADSERHSFCTTARCLIAQ